MMMVRKNDKDADPFGEFVSVLLQQEEEGEENVCTDFFDPFVKVLFSEEDTTNNNNDDKNKKMNKISSRRIEDGDLYKIASMCTASQTLTNVAATY